jgi:hypothetical protein
MTPPADDIKVVTVEDDNAFREHLGERFRGHILAVTYWEALLLHYRGTSDAEAVAVTFEDIAERAVEVLLRRRHDQGPPIREIRGRIFVAHRRQGVWRPQQ